MPKSIRAKDQVIFFTFDLSEQNRHRGEFGTIQRVLSGSLSRTCYFEFGGEVIRPIRKQVTNDTLDFF